MFSYRAFFWGAFYEIVIAFVSWIELWYDKQYCLSAYHQNFNILHYIIRQNGAAGIYENELLSYKVFSCYTSNILPQRIGQQLEYPQTHLTAFFLRKRMLTCVICVVMLKFSMILCQPTLLCGYMLEFFNWCMVSV